MEAKINGLEILSLFFNILLGIDPDAKDDTTTVLSASKKSAMPKDGNQIIPQHLIYIYIR